MNTKKINYGHFTRALFLILVCINFIHIEFIGMIIYVTTNKIIATQQASEFIQTIGTIPFFSYTQTIVLVNIFFFLFVLLMWIEKRKTITIIQSRILTGLSFICCALIVYFLQLSSNSIVLLFIVFILYRHRDNKDLYMFLGLGILLYVVSNSNILPIFHSIPLSEYISWYSSKGRLFLNFIDSVLNTLNMILFILEIFSIMVFELDENKRIKALNEELQHLNQQLEEYAVLQEKMGETKERNRLAREIHDTLGHTLTGLSVGIDAAIVIMDIDKEATKKQLSILSQTARQGLTDVRRSVEKLRPDALERFTLKEALERLILDFETVSNVNIKFVYHIDALSFQQDMDEVIYRIVQEGLTNAIRHGKAKNIFVSFAYEDNKSKLVIIIEDDGIGCQQIEEGFGLHHMKERIEILQGRLQVYGYDGFIIIAEIPLRTGDIT
ncbi:sensor histidine kinase [Floccifex sp.]|uniref:sensor histidine kinase n=1 Tax=Floccifex sp. TaxID=2815810 RepID=UPI003F0A6FB0